MFVVIRILFKVSYRDVFGGEIHLFLYPFEIAPYFSFYGNGNLKYLGWENKIKSPFGIEGQKIWDMSGLETTPFRCSFCVQFLGGFEGIKIFIK